MARTAAGASAQRTVRVNESGAAAPIGSSADPIYTAGTSGRYMIGPFVQDNIAASQTNVRVALGATAAPQQEVIIPRDGFVTAITASFTVAPAGSSLILKVYKNGAALDATAILTVTTGASLRRSVTFVAGTAALGFVAGDALGIAVLTDGSWTATTSDTAVHIELQA